MRPAYSQARQAAEANRLKDGDNDMRSYRGETQWTDDDGTVVTMYTYRFGMPQIGVVKPNGAKYHYVSVIPTEAGPDAALAAAIEQAKKYAMTDKQANYKQRRKVAKQQRFEARREAKVNAAKFLLVKWAFDYGDEFDVCGSQVYSQQGWQSEHSALQNARWPMEKYFGTNESLTWSSLDDFMGNVTISPISEHEYKVLLKFSLHPYNAISQQGWPDVSDYEPEGEDAEKE
jgi:hypothetical protein